MKRFCASCLAVALLLLAGCGAGQGNSTETLTTGTTLPPDRLDTELPELLLPEDDLVLRGEAAKEWNQLRIPALGDFTCIVEDVQVSQKFAGNKVYLLKADYKAVLAVEYYDTTAKEVVMLFKDLESSIFGGEVYLCDVDGDGRDEILVNFENDGVGGSGGYTTAAFRFADGVLQELPISDAGFAFDSADGFKFIVRNQYTGYEKTFDFRNCDSDYYYWNADGTVAAQNGASVDDDRLYNIEPMDVDGDGAWEFEATMYASLRSHGDYIGDAKAVWKYDAALQAFRPISAAFIVLPKYDTEYDRNIRSVQDLKNPVQIEKEARFACWFEEPYRYAYQLYDDNGKVILERGVFGFRPQVEWDNEILSVCESYSDYTVVYYDTKTGKVSLPIQNVVTNNEEKQERESLTLTVPLKRPD
ncbi:MAG: hypothetical protein LBS96_01845 [Oscillospiraceae bacterium]|jgi:hypothetical protein|nr:hypothetical protein [Oscillospiraceae bacterium]